MKASKTVLIFLRFLVILAFLDQFLGEEIDIQRVTSRPKPTPVTATLPPPPVTDEYCDDIKPCGQKCPEHAVWKAGNPCTDHCLKDMMDCAAMKFCGCYCTGNYRKDQNTGICMHKNCCDTMEF